MPVRLFSSILFPTVDTLDTLDTKRDAKLRGTDYAGEENGQDVAGTDDPNPIYA